MEKKKVIFICQALAIGGTERVLSILAEGISAQGHTVKIIMTEDFPIHYNTDEKIELIKFPRLQGKGTSSLKVKLIKQILRDEKPDMVIPFAQDTNILTLLACRKLKCKVIISERNDPVLDPLPFKLWLMKKLLYKKADGFVFQTEAAKKFYSKLIQKKSVVIGNPILSGLPNRHDGERKKQIIGIGRLVPQKNFKLLIDAFKLFNDEINDYKLIIYGEGYLREQLQQQINDYGLTSSVELKPFETDNLHKKIVDSAMLVQSSDYEGVSNVMLECMAIGLPVIVTDQTNGGPKQYIKDSENGIIVPLKDKVAMSKAMIRLASNKELQDKISKNSGSIKETLSREKIFEEWGRYIGQVISGENRKWR